MAKHMAANTDAGGRRGSTEGETRLQMRILRDQKALLERAAKARGMSITDFVISSALPAAEKTLADRTFFLIPEEDYARLNRSLDEPPRVNPRLRAQLDRRTKWSTLRTQPSPSAD